MRGANGVVYHRPGTEYVTKACAAKTDRNTASLIREVGLLRYLGNHPCIASLLSVGSGEIVLQYGGVSLRAYLASPIAADTRRICAGVVSAVHLLHGCGVAHRDIKPENILLAGTPAAPIVRLCDFGVSQRIGDVMLVQRGAPAYCAPELIADGKAPDLLAADMWALGCVLYEIDCGRGYAGDAASGKVCAGSLWGLYSGCFGAAADRPVIADLCVAFGVDCVTARPALHWYVRPVASCSAAALHARRGRYDAIAATARSVRAFCLAANIVDQVAYGEHIGNMVQPGLQCTRAQMATMPGVATYIAEVYLGERVSSVTAPPPICTRLIWRILATVHLEQLLICDMGIATIADCSAALLSDLSCKRSEDAYALLKAEGKLTI